ncbi:hypothetical protein SAMN05216251_12020 [Actinacidiphila alni]|uniref:DUF6895 domain-containing protein n=1 Tax=Actinacidiphila alni TaxID=380248 RepID=A0A1I2JTX7_9ACTN|nr:hypothetical protein [Actinacidiphila alni]SFF58255.1 hypothetical protein SAMN05216251_12020 [Actinacidiphila alni]
MTGADPRGGTAVAAPAREHPDGGTADVHGLDPALLDSMAGSALRWLDGMRDCFRLPADVTTDADPNLTLKPLGELAELTHLIRTRHPRADVRTLAEGLFAFAWEETRGGALFGDLLRGEPRATYPVELYGVFARTGLRHPGVEELIRTATGLRGWRVAREDHTRTLGVLNAERRIGLPEHADFAEVLAMTGLGCRSEPWTLDRKAAYGVTHDVFHLTDWGRARERMPADLAEYLRLWVPSWLECWLEEELWDLAGEWLAVSACLPVPVQDPAAWRRLAAAQAPDGSVPESGTEPPPGPDEADAFTACYHSTLVTAFAATLARIGAADGSDTAPHSPAPHSPSLPHGPAPHGAAATRNTAMEGPESEAAS